MTSPTPPASGWNAAVEACAGLCDDIDLLPEQIVLTVNAVRMAGVCEVYKRMLALSAARAEALLDVQRLCNRKEIEARNSGDAGCTQRAIAYYNISTSVDQMIAAGQGGEK